MFDAKTASPEQVSQLIAEMKEAKNKAFMLQNQIDEVFIHSKNSGLSIFHDEEDQELYFLNCFEGTTKGISMISTFPRTPVGTILRQHGTYMEIYSAYMEISLYQSVGA